MDNAEKLALLRAELIRQGLDGFVIPMNDEFQSEYVPEYAKRILFMTGFTGSAGTVIVLQDKAAFFTDGRYTLQAAEQVDGALYGLYNSTELSPQEWITHHLPPNAVLGFDSWLHTMDNAQSFAKACAKAGSFWRPCVSHPVDTLWKDKPLPPQGKAVAHPLEYAGEDSRSKRERIARELRRAGRDAVLLTLPDSICWLLNIRGNDVHCTPFALCYALLQQDGTVDLYIDSAKLDDRIRAFLGTDVRIQAHTALITDINTLKNKHIQCDPSSTSLWFFIALEQAGAVLSYEKDPCQLPKACKNLTEQAGAVTAHIRDGVAVCRFLHWLETALEQQETVSEISAAERLLSFRKQQQHFLYPSFDTIAGFGANGAIVHYHANKRSNKILKYNGLFLLDSGGQYLEGTTDITRTVAIGAPTTEQVVRFTQVLKGHIMLAMAQFPAGTTGSQLDALARYPLWQAGCDYGHGTGHGVGSCLSVHEGPQRISKVPNSVALQPGMILSNEPGYYKAGEYGIRIENLVLVERHNDIFLRFWTLTRAPIDTRLIDKGLLTADEIHWLNHYHQQVYEDIVAYSDDPIFHAWLQSKTQPI